MFEKEFSDCPGKVETNIRAKRSRQKIKALVIIFFLALLIIFGRLGTINAASPAFLQTQSVMRNAFNPSWVNDFIKRITNDFFNRLSEIASPRLIIVNPQADLGPTPVLTLTPTPALAVSPSPTPSPTPTAEPTAVPTLVPTSVPTNSPTPTPTVPAPTATPTAVPAENPVPSSGYSVSGGVIHQNGQAIAFNGVNWFGFETSNNVVHGLWSRNYKDMIKQIKDSGFNSVRIPFCPNTVQNAAVSGVDYSQNSDLQGLGSLEILDKIAEELKVQNMHFVLDHHRPDCNAISELPTVSGYSESQWINDLVTMTRRYQKFDNFAGMDLKNEPHGAATWGTGDSTDWKLAAEKAGKAVLEADPNILILVEGIQNNPIASDNSIAHWWGGNLEPQAVYPINLPTEKLVLSPHVYGPDVFPQDYFNAPDFPNNMPAIWEKHFGYLAGKYALAIGEWGGKYGAGNAKDKIWQDALTGYLSAKGICNSFYWSWNPNSGDTGGILNDDWKTVRQDKVEMLQKYAGACKQP